MQKEHVPYPEPRQAFELKLPEADEDEQDRVYFRFGYS